MLAFDEVMERQKGNHYLGLYGLYPLIRMMGVKGVDRYVRE
jgi:hypothetical protein